LFYLVCDRIMINNIAFLFIGLILTASFVSPFGTRQDLGLIDESELQEISGIAASRILDNIFWVHNDSGNDSKIYAIDRSGKLRAEFTLQGVKCVDTEDIAVGPGRKNDKRSYIYLADIGDNDADRKRKSIFRFPEPMFTLADTVFKGIINNIDVLNFVYPDGKRDAETIMIEPIDRDIVIVSKREKNVHVYSSPIPESGSSTLIFKKIAVLPYGNEGYGSSGVTGGDISPDGKELLIKTYSKVFYYKREADETLPAMLAKTAASVDYVFEPQGEAICFAANGEGFYTTSEISPFKVVPHLYYYPRLASGIDDKGFWNKNESGNDIDWSNTVLYNINGVQLLHIKDLGSLNAGLYFINYKSDDTAFIRKLLIVK